MGIVVFLVMLGLELVLMGLSFWKGREKRQWVRDRFVIRVIQMVLYWVMMLLPGVAFDSRFKALFVVLLIQFLIALITWCVKRGSAEGKKHGAGLVAKAVGSAVLYFCALIPSFLFTGYQGLPTSGEYEVAMTEAILIDADRPESFEQDGSKREIPVHFYYPQADGEKNAFPLVIFSHGAFGYYESNTSTYMELASNGYVVLSLDHPYHSFFTEDTAGKTITVDPEFMSNAMYINEDGTPEEEIFALSSSWLAIRSEDIDCVIDSVKKANGDGALERVENAQQEGTPASDGGWFFEEAEREHLLSAIGMADTEQIGVMGQSLGGAAAVDIGRQRDDIKAVIDLDGTMIGERVTYSPESGTYSFAEEPYPVPLLAVNAEYHHVMAEEQGSLYVNNAVIENAIDGSYTYIKNAGHMNFTDLPLFSPPLAALLGTGSIDATHCIEEVNGIVLMYFDHYLKNKGEVILSEYYE